MREYSPEAHRDFTRLRLLPRLARSVRKRYFRSRYGDGEFITSYFGARFHVQMTDMVAREIALQNFERPQIEYFINACSRFRPESFIDIGANIGLYSCILLSRRLVSRAILFEPDRENFERLLANVALNNLEGFVDCRQRAVSATTEKLRLVPGPEANRGKSRIDQSEAGYEVVAAPLDDVLHVSGQTLAIKMDVEEHELSALSGMQRTLRENGGIIQVECKATRGEVFRILRSHGYSQTEVFDTDVFFEK